MSRWMKPEEEMPVCEVGDRILLIIMCRLRQGDPMEPHLDICTATEDGWESESGWTPEDALLWSNEKDVCGIAAALGLT